MYKLTLTTAKKLLEIGDVWDVLPLEDKNGKNISITINGNHLISKFRCIESDSIRVQKVPLYEDLEGPRFFGEIYSF